MSGCNFSFPKVYHGNYKDYAFEFKDNKPRKGFYSTLFIYAKEGIGYIQFNDLDNDYRFDSMELINIPRGDSLEKFASLNIADEILNQLELDSEDSSKN